MTVSYPYSLASFADRLRISTVVWDVQRNDELSGLGSGQIIAAELAPPLWIGTVTMMMLTNDAAKQIAALVRKLHGSQEAFFLYDPISKYPQADRDGSMLGGNVVQVASIGGNRDAFSLKGLPAGYILLPGDKVQITYGTSPTRYAFLEVSEDAVANGSGITPQFGVFPHIPTGISVDAIAVLAKPACRCIIVPGSHNPGTARKTQTEGAGFKVIQKK